MIHSIQHGHREVIGRVIRCGSGQEGVDVTANVLTRLYGQCFLQTVKQLGFTLGCLS